MTGLRTQSQGNSKLRLNPVYQSPLGVVRNYNRLSFLKQHRLLSYISGGQKSEISLSGLESRFWQGCIPSEVTKGKFFYLPFPGSRSCPQSLPYEPFPSSKSTMAGQVFVLSHHSDSHPHTSLLHF